MDSEDLKLPQAIAHRGWVDNTFIEVGRINLGELEHFVN